MAETYTPENTRVGVEFRLSSAEMELFVNGVPVFSPDEGLSTQASVVSGLDFNTSAQQGLNTLTVRARYISNDDGFAQAVRLRLLHWPAGLLPNIFGDNVPHLADVQLVTDAEGLISVVSETGAQDAARVMPAVVTPQRVAAGEWITVTIPFELDMPFPNPLWPDAARRLSDQDGLNELASVYRQIHDSASGGATGLLRAIKPSMDRAATGYNWSGEQFFEHAFGILFDAEMQFSLQPLDLTDRKVRLFADGKLATIIPSPLTYVSNETGETAELWLYFWKDQNNAWRLMQ